jgi:hypothetical protein
MTEEVRNSNAHVGPAVIDSHNKLQIFIGFFMCIDHNNYLAKIPFIVT